MNEPELRKKTHLSAQESRSITILRYLNVDRGHFYSTL